MLKGNTNGFDFEIDEDVLDDWDLVQKLNRVDNGEPALLDECLGTILGTDQWEALKNHIRDESGRLRMTRVNDVAADIFEQLKPVKK